MQYVCIDIGGTAVKYGLADEQGAFIAKGQTATEVQTKGALQIIRKVADIVSGYRKDHDIGGVAISTAGIVHPKTGEILYAPDHFPGYTGIKLRDMVTEACHLPCTVENDVNAAGMGEYWLGAGRGASSLFCLTIGTGIGGCVIIDGRLIRGASYSAGEIGFLEIDGAATFEKLASVTALIHAVAAAKQLPIHAIDGKQIFHMAQSGDDTAVIAIDRMIQYLASGIANVCYTVNPEVVIIGGGIAAQQQYLRPRLMAALEKKLVPLIFSHTRVTFAHLQNDAGMTGALYYFLQRQKENG